MYRQSPMEYKGPVTRYRTHDDDGVVLALASGAP